MRGKNTIRIVALTVVAALSFVFLRSGTPVTQDNAGNDSKEQCCKKKDADKSGKMIWESQTQQFFSPI